MIAVTRSFGAWRLETTDSCNMASVTQIEDLDACSTARTAGTAGTAKNGEHYILWWGKGRKWKIVYSEPFSGL